MNKKWKKTAAELARLTKHYQSVRKSPKVSVHKTLVYRALDMLCAVVPDAAEFYLPLTDTIIDNVCRPDNDEDYECGTGRHYYCVTNSYGIRKIPSEGYYKNGIRKFAKSARSMFEEDYTMALTMYKAGFTDIAAGYFARAVHMLSDICCLPHVTGMTYFSDKKEIHKAYEALARALYPDALPKHSISQEKLHLFNDAKSFGDALNDIAEAQADEPDKLHKNPIKSITERLYTSETTIAALMYRFMCDTSSKAAVNGCIPDKSYISGFDIRIKVTEKGLRLLTNDSHVSVAVDAQTKCGFFRAAHRFDGLYTFSPVSDNRGRSVILRNRKLRPFNPNRNNQLCRIIPED